VIGGFDTDDEELLEIDEETVNVAASEMERVNVLRGGSVLVTPIDADLE